MAATMPRTRALVVAAFVAFAFTHPSAQTRGQTTFGGCPLAAALFYPCAIEKMRHFSPPRTVDGLPDMSGFWSRAVTTEDIHERSLNQLLGVIPGFANGLIVVAILSALLLAIPLSEGLSERTRDSALVNRLAVYAERLEGQLRPVFGDAISRTMNLLTIRPDSDERVTLPFKVENTRPRPDLEKRMLDLVNQERVANGLSPLQADPELTEVARKHSADMFARGYFAHDTPEGLSPFDRMREANVRFTTAGENLALAPTIPVAHSGLMNSPGHRANILRREFGRVGIGVLDGGMRGLMVSQEFRN